MPRAFQVVLGGVAVSYERGSPVPPSARGPIIPLSEAQSLSSAPPVELIPTLGAISPRGGPVQDPVLTRRIESDLPQTLNPTGVGTSLSRSRAPPRTTVGP